MAKGVVVDSSDIIVSFATSVAANYFTNFTSKVVISFFRVANSLNSEIAKQIERVKTVEDAANVVRSAASTIRAAAGSGKIDIDGAFLTAAEQVEIDHQHGTVKIAKVSIVASRIFTGGTSGATGRTHIGENTNLNSRETSIGVGRGCFIQITGDASIEQT
ncbi:MAG TPA: hypothetical protein VGM76_17380 [Lacipirellulaceae bacterium]